MSDNLARVPQAGTPERSTELTGDHRRFQIVSPASRHRSRPRIVYALTAIAGVSAIIVAQLLLSVGISQGAYEISSLQASQAELGRTEASVNEDLASVSSPQSLAANAAALGMVSNSNPVYLRLSDGAVLGAPSSASGSHAGAASLVPNSLLGDNIVLSQLSAGAAGADVAGAVSAVAVTSAPVVPAGLPSPTTR
ncbi:hypothetical protein [Cryobacterium psychrophilum]|uniref:Uncharacterized protein n=1 Tax=Cryobacterium psychrophilum TaxID=41988 RepID=A0A4Y8KQU8_9MICO|nr:hypothetical protein [Cryobacterium psychrophilum]TDW31485.1 hypothetical protein EDD25_3302 [Cryobacterium psychrophilum]TFD78916.1 hypothetical protein E3T53_09045 [Cryobacterium psychrophilum]